MVSILCVMCWLYLNWGKVIVSSSALDLDILYNIEDASICRQTQWKMINLIYLKF